MYINPTTKKLLNNHDAVSAADEFYELSCPDETCRYMWAVEDLPDEDVITCHMCHNIADLDEYLD